MTGLLTNLKRGQNSGTANQKVRSQSSSFQPSHEDEASLGCVLCLYHRVLIEIYRYRYRWIFFEMESVVFQSGPKLTL